MLWHEIAAGNWINNNKQLFTEVEVNNCFSIYHTSWRTSGTKNNFTCLRVTLFETGSHFVFFSCSEVNSNWLITSELANQRARKAPFSCVVYTNINYLIIYTQFQCFKAFTLSWSKKYVERVILKFLGIPLLGDGVFSLSSAPLPGLQRGYPLSGCAVCWFVLGCQSATNSKMARDPIENQHLVNGPLQKTNDLDKLYSRTRDMITWYWSADNMFWQVSIDQNMDIQYQRKMV